MIDDVQRLAQQLRAARSEGYKPVRVGKTLAARNAISHYLGSLQPADRETAVQLFRAVLGTDAEFERDLVALQNEPDDPFEGL